MIVILYLVAIVSANLIVAQFGPSATIINAFVLIGFDLTARDALHEKWQGKNLWRNMFILIAAGGMLSYWVNKDAYMIAVASTIAFVAAGIADTLVYQLLGKKSRLLKMNGSNSVSAGVDSLLFPTIAFGGFLPLVTLGQYLAKVLGGALWSIILGRTRALATPEQIEEFGL